MCDPVYLLSYNVAEKEFQCCLKLKLDLAFIVLLLRVPGHVSHIGKVCKSGEVVPQYSLISYMYCCGINFPYTVKMCLCLRHLLIGLIKS